MYGSLADFFHIAEELDYVVLRNYEEFSNEHFLADHPDIDLLCKDRELAVNTLGLMPKIEKDITHYYTRIDGKIVMVDLRHVGDGYYCREWETDMLLNSRRINGIKILNPENYYYSLIYHILIHKMKIKSDYIVRLNKMAERLSLAKASPNNYSQVLNKYMSDKGYRYTLPKYTGTICNLNNINLEIADFSRSDYYLRKVKCLMGVKYLT